MSKSATDHLGTAPNYDFVNTIRFVAIALIVLGHTYTQIGHDFHTQKQLASTLFYSLQKFDIVGMYLVSGFLMGDATARSTEYVMRRIKRTVQPWAIWVMLLFLVSVVGILTKGETPNLIEIFITTTLHTPYWFIPNYIFSLMFMFFIFRYLPRQLSGILLLCATLAYGANLYTHWFRTEHYTAWFGFMFYLWLGAYVKKNWPTLGPKIRSIDWRWYLLGVVVTGVGVSLETSYIMTFSTDTANALKFTNHLYSIFWCLLLITFPWRIVPRWIDSRRESFGVYLVHPLVLIAMYQVFKRVGWSVQGQAEWIAITAWIVVGVIAYLLSIALVKALVRMGKGRWVGDTV